MHEVRLLIFIVLLILFLIVILLLIFLFFGAQSLMRVSTIIDRPLIEIVVARGSGPQFKLITVTVAAMTTVVTDRYVHREQATTTAGPGLM